MPSFRRLVFPVALALLIPVFSVHARENEDKAQAAYVWLMENNAAFAAMENTFMEAKSAFLEKLPEPARPAARRFLASVDTWDLQGRWEGRRDHATEDALAAIRHERALLFRYMEAFTRASFEDAAYAALIRPVLLGCTQYIEESVENETARALRDAETLAANAHALPDAYQFRIVDGKRWVLIHNGTVPPSTDNRDSIAAYVLRESGESWAAHPIIAPVPEQFFPDAGEVPRLEEQYTPQGYAEEPALFTRLAVNGDDGPFAFTLELRPDDHPGSGTIRYLLVPECDAFPYVWSEESETYLRGTGQCAAEGEWGALSPFKDDGLVFVGRFRRELMREDPAFKAGEDALAFTWDAFTELFAGGTAVYVRGLRASWSMDRDYALLRHVGDAGTFAAASADISEPVVQWMHAVLEAASTHDILLPFLLGPLHDAWQYVESVHDNALRENRNTSRELLLADADTPWLSAMTREMLKALAAIDAGETVPSHEIGRAASHAKSATEGQLWQFTGQVTLDRDANRLSASYVDRAATVPKSRPLAVALYQGSGEYWGTAESDVRDSTWEPAPGMRVMRFAGGAISFVTPELPDFYEFFSNYFNWPEKGRPPRSVDCNAHPGIRASFEAGMFTLDAVLVLTEPLPEGWVCVPECEIPYTWDGKSFIAGKALCLPEGEWGILPVSETP